MSPDNPLQTTPVETLGHLAVPVRTSRNKYIELCRLASGIASRRGHALGRKKLNVAIEVAINSRIYVQSIYHTTCVAGERD
jgi:hypothetical protein